MSEFLTSLGRVLTEPLFVLAVFALAALLVLWRLFRSLSSVADRLSRRRALREFVAGVDLFFKGEHEGARAALEKVLERDPENHEARVLLGDACRELGDLPEAHKHHYQVDRVFGQDLPRNRLSLGRDLLLMGRAEEALPHLEAAAAAFPEDRGVAELLLSSRLAAGRSREAVALARRLAEEEGGLPARRRLARVLSAAGREALERGDPREAAGLLRAAVRANAALVAPRLDLVRAALLSGSPRAAEKELSEQVEALARLSEDGRTAFERPGPNGPPPAVAPAAPGAAPGEAEALPPPAVAALPGPAGDTAMSLVPAVAAGPVAPAVPARAAAGVDLPELRRAVEPGLVGRLLAQEAAWVCPLCGYASASFSEACPDCGAYGGLSEADPRPLLAVPDVRGAIDEVTESRAFIQSLVRKAAGGDARAGERLLAVGVRAVPGIFRELLRVADNGPLVRILSALGATAAPVVIDAWRRASGFSTRRLVREGVRAFRSLDGLLSTVLCGMGREVTPLLTTLLVEGDRAVRAVALEALIRLGEAERVESLRLDLTTKETLERLNACPAAELAAFLDAVPEEGWLAGEVLTDRTFGGEAALVEALTRPGNARKVRRILLSRGFSATTYEALEPLWGRNDLEVVVSDVIRSYGRAAADHLMKTCTAPGVPDRVRETALQFLTDLPAEDLERAVERLAEGDQEDERAAVRMVQAFGARAVPMLVKAYRKTGLLEKVGLTRKRPSHRKIVLIRALGEIGGHEAREALRQILEREADPELVRRIAAALGRPAGGDR